MIHTVATITSLSSIAFHTYILKFRDGDIARTAVPGQFLNIKVTDAYEPLLRRPYSVSQVEDDTVSIMFSVVGKGTAILSQKKPGDTLDVIGPLGRGYDLDGDYETAVLVGGGIGVAPFPFLCSELKKRGKPILSFVGARKSDQLVTMGLDNVILSTDDASTGFHGTVIDCLKDYLAQHQVIRPRVFACGPNKMLKALAEFTKQARIGCMVSLESQMACGIGICQGCPIESTDRDKKYYLACKDGPVFDVTSIVL
jgi:dihydroorotate dehydrogenase electron transfer subunit